MTTTKTANGTSLRSWKAEVIADNSGKWTSNQLLFTTKEEAEAYAIDLKARWILVRETRVVEVAQPPTHRWKGSAGRLEYL
jgi:hypothetical protein